MSALLKPSLNWLLIFLPIAIVLEIAHGWLHAAWATPTAIFVCSAIAIIPAAGWMGRATEHLAEHLGAGIGGLLNATFGNAAEMIIAATALLEGMRHPEKLEAMHNIVKASLTGSIIGNILLVMGLALAVGGFRYKVQTFNVTAARAGATMMILSVVALLIPALYSYSISAAETPEGSAGPQDLSLEIAVILLAVYGLHLLFTLGTHKHLYVGQAAEARRKADAEAAARGETAASAAATTPVDAPGVDDAWSVRTGLGVLLAATAAIALLAEFMVGSVEAASQALGLTELFVGVIVVAIVGNAAEHSTAVLMAWRNRMDLSLSIAIGSSIQIALLIAPLLVLLSYALGTPMDLVFTVPEIAAVFISAWVLAQIAGDGKSHWLEGALLLTVYVLLGLLFFHLPGG